MDRDVVKSRRLGNGGLDSMVGNPDHLREAADIARWSNSDKFSEVILCAICCWDVRTLSLCESFHRKFI